MTTSANRTIFQRGLGYHDEGEANAALYPGHVIELMSTGKYRKQSEAGARAERLIACEDALQGSTIETAFAAADIVPFVACAPGDRVLGRLPAAAVAVAKGDRLRLNGDGCVVQNGTGLASKLFSATAESSEHENTTDAANFDVTYSLPANSLEVGDVLKIKAQVTVNDNNSTDTLTLLLTIGGITIATTGAVDVADGDVGYFECDLVVRAIGAAATAVFQASGVQALGVPGTVTAKPFFKAEGTSFDTTIANVIAVNADWSVAHADNEASLSLLDVELIRGGEDFAVALESVDNSAGVAETFVGMRIL